MTKADRSLHVLRRRHPFLYRRHRRHHHHRRPTRRQPSRPARRASAAWPRIRPRACASGSLSPPRTPRATPSRTPWPANTLSSSTSCRLQVSWSLRGCVRSLGHVLEWRYETQTIPQRPDRRTVGCSGFPTPISQDRGKATYCRPTGGRQRHCVRSAQRLHVASHAA